MSLSGEKRLVLVFAAAGALSLLLLWRLDGGHPFRWVWLIWACAFAFAAQRCRNRARIAALNFAGAAGVLLVFEFCFSGGLTLFAPAAFPHAGAQYDTPHSIRFGGPLGYAPTKNMRSASKKISGGAIVYDVTYSIDENGFRRTPLLPASSPAALFFGDSFTFGNGVNDAQAFPAVFQAKSGFKAINLAFSGYGPHQMLRTLETGGEAAATAPYRPLLAFYLLLPSHDERAAGTAYWDPGGPRYELDERGSLHYRGAWRGRMWVYALKHLSRSAIVKWYWHHWPRTDGRKELDLERLVAIIAESRRIFEERYRGDFVVLLWDQGDSMRIQERLLRRGISFRRLSDAIPGIRQSELYLPHDGHPRAALQREVGLYAASMASARKAR